MEHGIKTLFERIKTYKDSDPLMASIYYEEAEVISPMNRELIDLNNKLLQNPLVPKMRKLINKKGYFHSILGVDKFKAQIFQETLIKNMTYNLMMAASKLYKEDKKSLTSFILVGIASELKDETAHKIKEVILEAHPDCKDVFRI